MRDMARKAGDRRELRDASITIRLPSSLRQAVDRMAERERRSVADIVIFAIEKAMKGQK